MSEEEKKAEQLAKDAASEVFEDMKGWKAKIIQGTVSGPDEIPKIAGLWAVGLRDIGADLPEPFYATFPLDGTDRTNELEDAIRDLSDMPLPSDEGRKALAELGIRTIAAIGIGFNSQGEKIVALCCHPQLTEHGCISFLKLSLLVRQQLLGRN